MKKIFLIISLVILSVNSFSQTKENLQKLIDKFPRNEEGEVVFTLIDTIPDKSKSDLYYSAYSYIIERYNSANNVIQMNDSIRGTIICKGSTSIGVTTGKVLFTDIVCTFYYPYTLKIQCKDNRYKVGICNIQPGSNWNMATTYNAPIEDYLNNSNRMEVRNIYKLKLDIK